MAALRWVRDLVGKNKQETPAQNEPARELPQGSELGIWHLKRLLEDYVKLEPGEKEAQLKKMIPLFCKIFVDRANELSQRFPESEVFAHEIGAALVREIQQRAINKSAKQACLIIADYLEDHSKDGGAGVANDGWNMLLAVRLLAQSLSPGVLAALAKCDLPSTLTKCLYLFFDLPPLPPLPPSDAASASAPARPRPSDAFADSPPGSPMRLEAGQLARLKSIHERRVQLHAEFTRALVSICQSVKGAEDITAKDDLCRLFGIVTSYCPRHCMQWRKLSSDILICIARCSLSSSIVSYVHRRSCIPLCVRNMNKSLAEGVSPLELIEMFVTLSCFIKDASETSYILLDDFRTSQGYRFLSDFLLRIEVSTHRDSASAMRNMVLLVSNLTKTGFVELQPPKPDGSPFQADDFVMPKPGGTDSVRNILAFQVLQSSFIKAKTENLCLRIVEIIFNIFSVDAANFFILEHQQTLSCFVEKMHLKTIRVQEQVLKLVEYVVCSLNYIPCPSLVSLSITLKSTPVPTALTSMILLNKLVSYDSKFRMIFRDLSLLDSIIYNLEQFSVSAYHHAKNEGRLERAVRKNTLGMRPMSPAVTSGQMTPVLGAEEMLQRAKKDADTLEREELHQAITRWKCSAQEGKQHQDAASDAGMDNGVTTEECARLSVSCLCSLLNDSPENVAVFHSSDGHVILSRMVEVPGLARSLALQIYAHLIVTSDTGEDEMSSLLNLLQSLSPQAVEVKTAIVQCILSTFVKHGERTRPMFRNVSGFTYVINVAASMADCLQQPPPLVWDRVDSSATLTLIRHIVALMTEVMNGDVANMYILHQWNPATGGNSGEKSSSVTITTAMRLLGCFSSSVKELPHYTVYQCDSIEQAAGQPLALSKDITRQAFRHTSLFSAAEVLGSINNMAMGRLVDGGKETDFYNGDLEEEEDGYRGWALPTASGDLMYPFAVLAMMEMLASLQPDHDDSARAVADFLTAELGQASKTTPKTTATRTQAETTAGQACTGEEDTANRQDVAQHHTDVHTDAGQTAFGFDPLDSEVSEFSENSMPVRAIRLEENLFDRVARVLMTKWYQRLQETVASVLSQMLSSESNQQRMCSAEFLPLILSSCRLALACEQHPLHQCSLRTVERLASQSMQAADLRHFLRLGNPLNCALHMMDALAARCGPLPPPIENSPVPSPMGSKLQVNKMEEEVAVATAADNLKPEDDAKSSSSNRSSPVPFVSSDLPGSELLSRQVPLSRVQSLVSLATPRSTSQSTTVSPPYIEFNMSSDGYGCIIAPPIAVAPVFASSPTPLVIAANASNVSVNTLSCTSQTATPNYRHFPPPAGLSVSAWLCIDVLSSPLADAHPLRLMSLIRSQQYPDSGSHASMCLSILLSARDRMLVVSTQEVDATMQEAAGNDMPTDFDNQSSSGDSAHVARFFCDGLTHVGAWHHLCVILHNPLLKQRTASVYLDGELVQTKKLSYISNHLPGGGTAAFPSTSDVTTTNSLYPVMLHTIFGSRRCKKRHSKLRWRLGPSHIFDESLVASTVKSIFDLGPCYVGSFQAPYGVGERESEGTVTSGGPLVAEDKISFGLNALSFTDISLEDLLVSGGERDGMSFLKEELSTLGPVHPGMPMRIFHNTALHLNGMARSFGGVVFGNFLSSVRCFHPQPVSTIIGSIGGIHVLLGLVAQATDAQMLYASVKALVCVVTTNAGIMLEMEKTGGFQVLATLLQQRRHHLNGHILHLTFSLVGTVDSNRESTVIPHPTAFSDLLGNLQFWAQTSEDIQKTLLSHFYDLIVGCSEAKANVAILRQMHMVERLMDILVDKRTSLAISKCIVNVVSVLLRGFTSETDLLCFGQFLISTLPSTLEPEESGSVAHRDAGEKHKHVAGTAEKAMPTSAALRQQQQQNTKRKSRTPSGSRKGSRDSSHGDVITPGSSPGTAATAENSPMATLSRTLSTSNPDLSCSRSKSPLPRHLRSSDDTSRPRAASDGTGVFVASGNQPSKRHSSGGGSVLQVDGFPARTFSSGSASFSPRSVPLNRVMEFEKDVPFLVAKRNLLLDFLEHALRLDSLEVDVKAATALADAMGLDWLLLFMHLHIHRSSVVRALRILSVVLSVPALQTRFQIGTISGEWQTKVHMEPSPSIPAPVAPKFPSRQSGEMLPGYEALTVLLSQNGGTFQILYILFAILSNTPVVRMPTFVKDFTAKSVEGIFDMSFVSDPFSQLISPAAAGVNSATGNAFSIAASRGPSIYVSSSHVSLVIVAIARAMMNAAPGSDLFTTPSSHPILLLQFLLAIYTRSLEFSTFAATRPFLSALVLCLFPVKTESQEMSDSEDDLDDDEDEDEDEFVLIENTMTGDSQTEGEAAIATKTTVIKSKDTSTFREIAATPASFTGVSLNSHIATGEVLNLLTVIALDSLLVSSGGSEKFTASTMSGIQTSSAASTIKASIDVLDLILELVNNAAPSSSASSHAQVTILAALMEHLKTLRPVVSSSLFSSFRVHDSSIAQHLAFSGSSNRPLGKFLLFCTRLADKTWQGVLSETVLDTLDFLLAVLRDGLPNKTSGKESSSSHRFFSLASQSSPVVSSYHPGLKLPPPQDAASRCASVYRSLNRVILCELSRIPDIIEAKDTDYGSIVAMLSWILKNHTIIFHPVNKDSEFLVCLLHHILSMSSVARTGRHEKRDTVHGQTASMRVGLPHLHSVDRGDAGSRPSSVQDISAVSASSSGHGHADEAKATTASGPKGHSEQSQMTLESVGTLAMQVWSMLIAKRRKDICEVLKIPDVSSLPPSLHAPEMLLAARSALAEQDVKFWMTYLTAEEKLVEDQLGSSPAVKSSHTRRRMFFRRLKSEDKSEMDPKHLEYLLHLRSCDGLVVVKSSVSLRRHHLEVSALQIGRYAMQEWKRVEGELLRERGLWGPDQHSYLSKWKLDLTEGPGRMRKRLVVNPQFYATYPFRPEHDKRFEVPGKNKYARSGDSKPYYHYYVNSDNAVKIFDTLLVDESSVVEGGDVSAKAVTEKTTDIHSSKDVISKLTKQETKLRGDSVNDTPAANVPILPSSQGSNDAAEFGQMFALVAGQDVQQIVYKALDPGERVRASFRCTIINGLDVIDAIILFGTNAFYIVFGLALLPNGVIVQMSSQEAQNLPDIVPKQRRTKPVASLDDHFSLSRCQYGDVKEIYKRRYCLVHCAIELFQDDGHSHFMAFSKTEQNKVYQRFIGLAKDSDDGAEQSLLGMKRDAEVESTSFFTSLINTDRKVTDRWLADEINNFQYLMYLNTIAGRSYNDLMQYPIFPWILADYKSEVLDLTNEASFRNLALPMGAQTPNRLKQFSQRFREWEDPTGTKPYYYGTHYSSAMIVSSYLIRLEPFTQHFLRLQGGHFDHADRMFHSMADQWASASEINMADIKELIPEFFYLPEFLENKNHFKLGVKQSGHELGDVILPPWAKGDAHEFIRVHREALECDYVTSRIHMWIDLIFGYKQQGPASIEAHNVFHHLFYEGAVNIDEIKDPLEKSATIGFINNFGQMPKQLFKKPHPQKKIKRSAQTTPADPTPFPPATVSASAATSTGSATTISGLSAVGSAAATDRLFYRNLQRLQPSLQPIKELQGPVGQIVQVDKDRSVIGVERNRVVVPPAYSRYLGWGFPDFSLRAGSLESDKTITSYEGLHTGQITCVVCPDPKTVITGGESSVICVWQLVVSGSSREKSRQLALKEILYGHTSTITCLEASTSYGIIVSAAEDGTCFLWDLRRLTFIRQLQQHNHPVGAICINALTGDVVTCAGTTLSWWSINGDLLAQESMPNDDNHAITCCAMSELCVWDSQNVIVTGSMDGVVRFWSMAFHDLHFRMPKDMVGGKVPLSRLSSDKSPTPSIADIAASSDSRPISRTVSPFFRPRLNANPLDKPSASRTVSAPSKVGDILSRSVSSPPATSPIGRQGDMSKSPSARSCVQTGSPGDSDKLLSRDTSVSSSPRPETPIIETTEAGEVCYPSTPDTDLEEDSEVPKDGPRWQRRLVLRGRLTMHTAFDRHDNKFPAAITALHISKDHRRLLVGDYHGRIYSWSVPEAHGKVADHWVPDDVADHCADCQVKFSLTERRHHCRNCGQVFCGKCSKYESDIPEMKIMRSVRVCESCFVVLKGNPSRFS